MKKKVVIVIRELPGYKPVITKAIQVPVSIEDKNHIIESWAESRVKDVRSNLVELFPEFAKAEWTYSVMELDMFHAND